MVIRKVQALKAQLIPIALIDFGDRRREDYGDISDLVKSINEKGLIQPPAVHQRGDRYTLLAGGRRFKACQLIGFEEIPVRIYDQDLDELDIRSIELAENMDRKDLSWAEEAKLKKEIHELQVAKNGAASISRDGTGWSQEDTARMLGTSRTGITQDLMLADAIAAMPELGKMKNKTDALALIKNLEKNSAVVKQRVATEKHIATHPDAARKKMLVDSFIVGDFFENVAKLPSNSFDMIELDPPYAIDLHGMRGDKNELFSARNAEYNEVKPSEYPEFMMRVLTECYRVASHRCWLICWHAHDWGPMITKMIREVGFSPMSLPAMWTKERGQTLNPACVLGSSWEPFIYARKGDAEINRKGHLNVFPFRGIEPANKIHPTERPIELIEEIMRTFIPEGSKVLVPFLGSGNTLLAGNNLHMAAMGFELSQIYKEKFALRVMEGSIHQYKDATRKVEEKK